MHRTSDDEELERYQHDQRSVTWRNEPDGVVTFTARLPPLVAGVMISRLTTHVMSTRPTAATIEQWPGLAQQQADALAHLLREGPGGLTTEVILHVREHGASLDDGTALPMSAVERIAPEAFIRALIHDADNRPINASAKSRHPSARQKRVVKERDQVCVDCGATTLLWIDPRGRQLRREEQVLLCFRQIGQWEEILDSGMCVRAFRTKAAPITSAEAARIAMQRFRAPRRRQRAAAKCRTTTGPDHLRLQDELGWCADRESDLRGQR